MHALSQPAQLTSNLQRLRAMSRFCRVQLRKAGVYVYDDDDSHILPIYTGRCSSAAKLSYLLLKAGVVAAPVTYPAVPFWEGRVRLCLSAGFDDETVGELLQAIVTSVKKMGLCSDKLQDYKQFQFRYENHDSSGQKKMEKTASVNRILDLITRWTENLTDPKPAPDIVDAAHRAIDTYGLGSGGSRWVIGTTYLHTRAEELIAERLGQPAALTYPDSYIGLSSTIAALCRTTDGYTSHALFIPTRTAPAIEDGLLVSPKKSRPTVHRYNDLASLVHRIREQKNLCYITVVLSSHDMKLHTAYQDLQRRIGTRRSGRNTVLIHDEAGMCSFVPDPVPQHTQRVLVYGSFVTAVNLPGSYLAEDAALIKELRYSSRAYMFTTSQMPFILGMVVAELEKTQGGEGHLITSTGSCNDRKSITPEVLVTTIAAN